MNLHKTSLSMIAALAVSGGAAYAQSGDGSSFCDAGYVRADTNSDGMIDENELGKVTEIEFSDLDANGDGMVTMAEYSDCRGSWTKMASSGNMLSDADVAALDTNKDGAIDQNEYMQKADQEYTARWSPTGGLDQKEVRDADFAPATPEDQADAGTESAAADQSGTDTTATDSQSAAAGTTGTTMQDDSQAAASGQSQEMLQAEPKLILRRIIFLPKDHPRGIADMSRDEVAQRSAQMFLLLDADRNKMIDPDEQKGASDVQVSMDAMLDEQFSRADADASGDLSREEYTADMQARWKRAQERHQNAGSDVGAPVVYYRYPHPM